MQHCQFMFHPSNQQFQTNSSNQQMFLTKDFQQNFLQNQQHLNQINNLKNPQCPNSYENNQNSQESQNNQQQCNSFQSNMFFQQQQQNQTNPYQMVQQQQQLKKSKKKSKLKSDDPKRLDKVTGFLLFSVRVASDRWTKLDPNIRDLYVKMSHCIQKEPPTQIPQLYSKAVIEYWKRKLNFPREFQDKNYDGFLPLSYGGLYNHLSEVQIKKEMSSQDERLEGSRDYITYNYD
ncbi:UNKNOWN [Stylonychia lemnae]|uniref:Uncharacterized protein n=1 Tax=Stylonychia lemnae TaxID=5949 RepID=A0A078BBS5_STYLE|nr:UNKNOWN [Stylonychia lemnae]|eukprot:CDW91834.1 UNKNOWN [Stylonychia lemnae]